MHTHTQTSEHAQTGRQTYRQLQHVHMYKCTQLHVIVTYTGMEGLKRVISSMDFSTT
jgi:hypothetical protein